MLRNSLKSLVGVAGLEPATSASRTQVELEFYNNLILFQYREYVDY